MPRGQQTKQFLNFVAGLNTESSPLVFPENTLKDGDNVSLNRDGSIKRRRGLNFESSGAYSTTTFSESDLENFAISTQEWTSVDGDDSLNFLVLQVGGVLYFHNLGAAVLSTAAIGSLDMSPVQLDADYTTEIFDYDSAKGVLFVVGRSISPVYVKYNQDDNSFTGVKLTIKIRDTDGIDDTISSPPIFGDDITPGPGVDPEDDIDDTLNPVVTPEEISEFIRVLNNTGVFV